MLVHLDAPGRLLLLLVVALLAVAYAAQQLRRRRLQRGWAEDALLASVAPSRPGPLRHLPALLVLASLVAMTTAFAEPGRDREVQRERATVVVALDTSASMLAQDVAPDRFTAAKAAAIGFVEDLPAGFDVALVGFHATASLQVPATSDHALVTRAINNLELSGGTALGDAILTSLSALRTPESQAIGAVIMLADGGSTTGSPLPAAVQQAADAGVPVSTIAYGTSAGVVISGGRTFKVPVDEQVLAQIADGTAGRAYAATTGSELAGVYDSIRTRLSTTTERQDLAGALSGVALALLLGAAVAVLVDRTVHSLRS
ncbi:MAG: VWA domain-containing protein [Frankiales bacterium]|nr:VWA domain-containing protein [Frankiales bacterium]